MKKWSILLTIFFFSLFFCSLKYGNMIRISNMSFCRFCCKNEKIDWPKCARTLHGPCTFHFNKKNEKNDKCCEQFCRFFCAGTIVLVAWKPLSYPPPPPFSLTNYHTFSSSLVPFLIFFISTAGTVRFSRRFHPQSTPDNSNLQGKSRSKENGTTSASRKLSRPPPPQIPPHLRRPCVNLLTKLVSR